MEEMEQEAQRIHAKASNAAEKNFYMMDNPYTSRSEKIEIECWYQLPLVLSGYAFLVTAYLWGQGHLTAWQAYGYPTVLSATVALIIWIGYNGKLVQSLMLKLNFPRVSWIAHLAVAGYLAYQGVYLQAALIVVSRFLAYMPVAFGGMFMNQIITGHYRMHPKYALLKRAYKKQYAFE